MNERELFERDGYLVFDAGVSETLLDGIVEDTRDDFVRGVAEGYSDGVRADDLWFRRPRVKELARAPRVLALLSELYGRKPRPFTTLSFRVGTEQAPHSDTIHFNSDPPGFMCGVWVALEDIDADNGPLVYYPGSHRLPEYTMQDAGLSPSADDYPKYEEFIRGVIERSGIEPVYGVMKKGQAIVWASNLLHGGSPRRDRTRSRHSQVTHYFFEGVRTLTPMLSTPERPHASDPHWIV